MNATAENASGEERRTYERVKVALFGRCLLPNGMELPCQITEISPGDLQMFTAHQPHEGERVITYVDHVGRLEGDAVRVTEIGFAMEIEASPRKREKLAARIEWLQAHKHFGVEDARAHERMEPSNKNSVITLGDGRTYPVEIIDISISGAAFSSPVKPALESVIALAGMKGRVVRHFVEGLAIEFLSIREKRHLFDKLDKADNQPAA
ncbi:MAG: PilZ domain-containing protein [Rhizobiaceae bacterium]